MTASAEHPGESHSDLASRLEAAKGCHERGDFDQAEALYLAILTLEPNHFTVTHLLGVLKHQQGDFQAATDLLQKASSQNPRSALAHLNLGLALWKLDRWEEALTHFRYSVRFAPDNPEALFQCAYAFQALRQPEEALQHWDRLLALNPDHPGALLNRGMVLLDLQRLGEALANFGSALALDSNLAGILLTHAEKRNKSDHPDEALALQEKVLEILPSYPRALVDRAGTLVKLGYHQQALAGFDLALCFVPGDLAALFGRAAALFHLQRPADSLACCERALAIQPDFLNALLMRGAALIQLNCFVETLATYEKALKLRPEDPLIVMNQAHALHLLGRNEQAIASYDRALALDPTNAAIHSRKIGLLDHLPEMGIREHQDERRRYYETHARPFEAPPTHHGIDRNPSRRLVLGYVSHSFMDCSTASIFLPILQRHAKADFQVICYSGATEEDGWTHHCRESTDLWRQVTNLSDEALEAQIRADGVDILIDLSGHTVGNRLMVFARKPAPIQVTAWGHGGGTGLPMVDYLFADPVAIPPSVRPLFAEQIYDLPCHLTFEAPPYAPPLVPLPALSRGTVTFGCLNRYVKVTPAVERLWARIIDAVPGSRLLLKAEMFDEPKGRNVVLETFARLGIGPDRMELRGGTTRAEHMAAFGDVDILLDPFPLNGGITTMESLWMGTPIIAKLGDTIGSRASGAILHAMGLGDWVAEDEEEYLDVAVRKAADIPALARFRQGIRSKFLASPAGNPELYTRAVESAYRSMWVRWLEQSSRTADVEIRA